jgi:hypothetical protein
MQEIENHITTSAPTTTPTAFIDASHGSGSFGIRAQVKLQNRVLEKYQEVDPALGYDTLETVLSILSYHESIGDLLRDGRMTVCLARRDDGRVVEVDLGVQHDCGSEQDCYYLRFAGERELGSDEE